MVKSARHTDGVGLNYFFPGLFLIYFLIISLFFEKKGGKKGGSRREGEGGLGSSFVYIRFERQYKIFFSGYRESTVF